MVVSIFLLLNLSNKNLPGDQTALGFASIEQAMQPAHFS
jgi:hypothetical protein